MAREWSWKGRVGVLLGLAAMAAIAVAPVSLLGGLLERPAELPALGAAERVRVSAGAGAWHAEVADPVGVAALTGFAAAHGEGWHTTWSALPSAPVRVCFHADRPLGCMGAGNDYLTWQGGGDGRHLVRSATPAEVAELARLAALPPDAFERRTYTEPRPTSTRHPGEHP